MDESAAAAIPEDGGENSENSTRHGDRTPEDDVGPSIEDTDDGVGVFCCQDCGEAFREEAAYSEHRQQHPHLEDHLDALRDTQKDNETPHYCLLCSASFVEQSEFERHMKKNHEEISQKESGVQKNATKQQQTYECPDCGKSYCVIGHFLNHMRSHRQPVKSVFNDLEHLKKKSFQCESCGRNYSRASALDAHRRCHEEKLVKSKNKSPGDAAQTGEPVTENKPSENQTERTPEKLFKCSCGKAFSAPMRLKTHQRFSRNNQCSGEVKQKPKKSNSCSEFYCSECKKNFSGHIALYNHQRWHANHSDDSAKRFPCEECGKVFMTLTFYYRHQRMAHSEETPAKSFLHQVCQLQKKAFECKHCGLKFSRASALHSHQLHHTEEETEKEAQGHASLQPQDKAPEMVVKEIQYLEASSEGQVESESLTPTNVVEEPHVEENDDDMESYEPGDFNVQVISASESEDEPVQDLNPDLELLCESDQEVKDDGDAEVSNRPEMDLKIVQIDFEQADEQCALIAREAENNAAEERFDCPDCYRWFSNPSSLRVHRMWHGVHKRRQQTQVKGNRIACKDCGLQFKHWDVYKTHLHQHALEEEEAQMEYDCLPAANRENGDEDTTDDEDGCDAGDSPEGQPSGRHDVEVFTASRQNTFRKVYTCFVCGKIYMYLLSFQKHQRLHMNESPTETSPPALRKYECPDCGMSFIRRSRLIGHLRVHRKFKKASHRCDQCSKAFTSAETWIAHVNQHKRKPFWCLSCAKGFRDETSLDEHLQTHNQGQCDRSVFHKTFDASTQITSIIQASVGPKPYKCTFCGMSFTYYARFLSHQEKHLKYYAKSGRVSLGSSAFMGNQGATRKTETLTSDDGEHETITNVEKLQGVNKIEAESQSEECGDTDNSEDSDCGEPVHHFKIRSPGSDPPGKSDLETAQAKPDLDETESQETSIHVEHKYWEWECIVCDMGFDEVAELHLHYVKHATGELPIPQDDTEG
ncbi:zinc finger protein 224 isoform X2 [Mugil cephalus]|uniref:zinc finger protein 224 isoform X2 n=1 Tax=Mugil cephalus TaxID=48193 RepID=UPI001FB68FA6|nr:zinc finger protein 224 isoform X2 [Mugil cephalus]